MYKIAICDDIERYREIIREVIDAQEIAGGVSYYEFESGEKLLEGLWQCFNLVFLDIQMPGIDGKETAKKLRKYLPDTVLVFCTNYQELTPELIKVQPYRYITKDLHNTMLNKEIGDIIYEMIYKSNDNYFTILQDGNVKRVPIKSIIYISVAKRGSIVHMYNADKKEEEFTKEHIKDIYSKRQSEGFEYAHSSYIVNLANIIQLNKNILMMKGNITLNISRSKKPGFDKKFADFLKMRYKRL